MTTHANRRLGRAAFLTAGAAFAVAPGRLRAQTTPVKIRIAGSPDQDIIGALWGAQSGIFARYGLDVDVQSANSGAVVAAAVVGGSIEIGKSSVLGLLTAHARGVPFLLEAAASIYNSKIPNTALIVAKDAALRTGRDFNGKTIAVPALGDLFTIVNSAWVDANGGDSRTVKFLELPGRAAAEAIAAGRVDGATLAEPILNDALATGKCRILGRSFDAIGATFIETAYYCTTDYASKNADAVARFRKALNEAVTYANAHRTEMIPVIARYSKVDEKTVAAMSPAPLAAANTIDPRLLQPMIDAALKYKAIPKPFPAKEIVDPSALG